MSAEMKALLALGAAFALMVAQFSALWTPGPTNPPGYPIIATECAPTWVDGYGVMHRDPQPNPWPTAIP